MKKYPSKFVGCCLANPAEDGSGIKELESLVLEVFPLALSQNISKSISHFSEFLNCYCRVITKLFGSIPICGRRVRRYQLSNSFYGLGSSSYRTLFNYQWFLTTQMTNDVGKAMFSKAGELGVPVGFMCMKVC